MPFAATGAFAATDFVKEFLNKKLVRNSLLKIGKKLVIKSGSKSLDKIS